MTRPMRPADLVPGRMYFSPSGRLCVLQSHSGNHKTLLFVYVSKRTGRPNADDSFALDPEAFHMISCMREAPIVQPEFAARFEKAAA